MIIWNIFVCFLALFIKELEAQVISCEAKTDCEIDHMECVKNKCSCIFPKVSTGSSCTPEVRVPSKYLEVSSSDNSSTNLADFLGMKGLHCGKEGEQFYRNGRFGSIRKGCFHEIYINFDQSWIKFADVPKFDALDMDVICNTTLMSSKETWRSWMSTTEKSFMNCSKNYKEFQLVYTNANRTRFYAGIYSTVSPREMKVFLATADNVPMKNASELEHDESKVKTVTRFSISGKIYNHPDCDAKDPTIVLDKCPTDSDPPTVYITPGNSSMYVHRHDNMTLKCTFVSLANIMSFKWIKHGKNGQTVLNETTHPDKFSVSFSGASRNLWLFKSDFILEDTATYQCIVSNQNGKKDDNVTVLISEEIPNPQITFEIYPLNLGGDVHLECMINAYPEITDVWWKKDDGIIDKTDIRYNGSIPQEPSLNISMTTTDDIGYYRCCANNSIGFNCSNDFILGYTPIIINSTHNAEAFMGKSLNINCEVKSAPRILDVTLQSKGTIVTANVSKVSTGNHQEKFIFTIIDPTLQDSGSYTCNATNVHTSSISDAITIEIYGVIFHDQPDENVTFGEIITIDCAVESHPPITELTEITWSLNGSCIDTNNTIKYPRPTPTIYNLTINNVTFSDQGEYTCAVENDKVNGTSGGFWLNVIGDLPNVHSSIIYNTVQHSAIISVNESAVSTLILTCSYESFPNETGIKWIKQNDDINQPLSDKATGGNLYDPNITFTSVQKSDEGNYTCFVTNAVGTSPGNSVFIQVNESMCPCLCSFKKKLEFWKNKNFTKEEMLEYMEPFLKQAIEAMKLEQKTLSKNIRKRTSARDGRKSSQQIGIVGIVFIVATFGGIIVFDIIAIKRYVQNIRGAFNRV